MAASSTLMFIFMAFNLILYFVGFVLAIWLIIRALKWFAAAESAKESADEAA